MKQILYIFFITLVLVCCSTAQAQTILLDETGEFSETDTAETNQHAIAVEAGQTVEVIVSSDGIDTTLTAILPDGQAINNDDYDDLNAGFIRTMTVSGTIEVTARSLSSGESGPYRILARSVPPAQSIGLGEIAEGQLFADQQGKTRARYQFAGEAGQRVMIDLKSYDFDTVLSLQTVNGAILSDDDGGDQGTNSRLHYQFEQAGSIILKAESLGGGEAGQYILTVTELSSEVVARHEGSLTVDDQRGYDGTRVDHYKIEGEAGQILTVLLESNDFDAVLYISNPDGSNLVRQDDHGEGTNSLAIVNLAEAGNYTVYVTALSNQTGNYQLTIYR